MDHISIYYIHLMSFKSCVHNLHLFYQFFTLLISSYLFPVFGTLFSYPQNSKMRNSLFLITKSSLLVSSFHSCTFFLMKLRRASFSSSSGTSHEVPCCILWSHENRKLKTIRILWNSVLTFFFNFKKSWMIENNPSRYKVSNIIISTNYYLPLNLTLRLSLSHEVQT